MADLEHSWIGVVMLCGMACASTQGVGDRYFESGRYLEAKAAFEAYLDDEPKDADRVARYTYRLGLVYALPNSPVHDPEMALEIFDSLAAMDPSGPYTPQAKMISELQRRGIDLDQDLRDSRARIANLEDEISGLEVDLVDMQGTSGERSQQIEDLSDQIDRLVGQRAQLRRQLKETEEELDRLKAIDLESPP